MCRWWYDRHRITNFYPVLIILFFLPSYFYKCNCHQCVISLVIPEVVLIVRPWNQIVVSDTKIYSFWYFISAFYFPAAEFLRNAPEAMYDAIIVDSSDPVGKPNSTFFSNRSSRIPFVFKEYAWKCSLQILFWKMHLDAFSTRRVTLHIHLFQLC